jgi:hypothetical protein
MRMRTMLSALAVSAACMLVPAAASASTPPYPVFPTVPTTTPVTAAPLDESTAEAASIDYIEARPDRLANVNPRTADADVEALGCGEQPTARRTTFFCLLGANVTDDGRAHDWDWNRTDVVPAPVTLRRGQSVEYECIAVTQVTDRSSATRERAPRVRIVYANCLRVVQPV